jgi:hypothetical protein
MQVAGTNFQVTFGSHKVLSIRFENVLLLFPSFLSDIGSGYRTKLPHTLLIGTWSIIDQVMIAQATSLFQVVFASGKMLSIAKLNAPFLRFIFG